ncbi:MAG: ferric iron uptake transcriptional regulator [Pseudomonadales bacterium]|jgi:Fur family ferric uptake transcriptional regulator
MTSESQELRKAGLKVTLPRVKIYQILEQANESDHWSAEDIYKQLIGQGEDIGLATVYRVLTQFEAAGLVVRHRFEGDHSVFELATEDSHDHLVCIKTGTVKEFNDPILNARIEEIAKEQGFEITGRTLHIYGISQD